MVVVVVVVIEEEEGVLLSDTRAPGQALVIVLMSLSQSLHKWVLTVSKGPGLAKGKPEFKQVLRFMRDILRA